MAAKQKNLSQHKEQQFANAGKYKIAIVVSEYHEEITFALRDGCINTFKKYGVKEKNIVVQRAPGAFELPLAAKWVFNKKKPDAVICLGCVIKGDTDHDKYINSAVSQAIMDLSLKNSVPFIFGVLTPNNMQQAKDRAGGKRGNKGVEAAVAALKMLELKDGLP
jgi:6,7-dimethyl-8-ribityllumazine synthase